MIVASLRRTDAILLAALLFGGLAAILLLKSPLYTDPHALGMHAVALVVPYVVSIAYAACAAVAGRLDRARAVATVGLFAALALPFADLWASPIVHFEADDSYRYSVYARHMLAERTLWGSDGMLHGRLYFVDQPGYRYYLAAAMALLGGEHRGLQLFNLGVLLGVAVATLRGTADRSGCSAPPAAAPADGLGRALAVFLLASAPYAAKNVLYGYTEWLAVALFLAAAVCLIAQRRLAAIVLLALAPFVRQNLLPLSLVLAAYTVVRTRRWWLVAPYLLVLGLPLYHNLYYAGEWRFFVENTGALVRPTGSLTGDVAAAIGAAASRLPHYVGYAPGQKLTTLAVAVAFAPLGSAVIVGAIATARGRRRALLASIAAAAVLPTLFFGSGSFPRFEYVNLSVIIASFAATGASWASPSSSARAT